MSIVYSSNNLSEIWRQVRLVVLPRLGVHEAEVPCWTILFLNNRRLQKLLTFQKEKKLEQESNIWIYPEEALISQGGEGINFFTFFGIVIAINSLWIKFNPSLSPPSQRQSFQAVKKSRVGEIGNTSTFAVFWFWGLSLYTFICSYIRYFPVAPETLVYLLLADSPCIQLP